MKYRHNKVEIVINLLVLLTPHTPSSLDISTLSDRLRQASSHQDKNGLRRRSTACGANDGTKDAISASKKDVKKKQGTQYLTGLDNVFLAIEDDHHLMTVSSIYTFDSHVDPAQIRDQVHDFAKHTECCHRILVPGKGIFGRNAWQDVPLNIDDHFRVVKLESPGTKAQLAIKLGEQISEKFDFSKPLWDTVFYEGLEDGGCVLFLKAHHCIADGQGFVRNLLSYVASLDPTKDRSSLQYSAGRNATPPATPQVVGKDAAATEVTKAKPTSKSPKNPIQPLINTFIGFFLSIHFLFLYVLNIVLLLLSQKRAFARTTRTANKQVGWSSEVSLDDVKVVKNALGVTVNDVLTASLAAAIERYLDERGAVKDFGGFWFFIPTSLRRMDDWSVSNKTSGYVLNVPLANGDIVSGVRQFNKRMKAKKGNPEPILNYWATGLGYLLPQFVPKIAKTVGFNRIHAVVTNVPGPSTALPWAGEPIKEIISFIPQSFPNSLGCTIYTYRNQVSISVMIDRDDNDLLFATGAAQSIVDEFNTVFAELLESAKNAAIDGKGDVKVKAA
ncbi:wax ester synthase-like acyl-CoA acyltransferase domain-containing protein [Chytridium lagenaria]|nr:wax ester synthase-like acyl-CoA acyltransferase domain-containing protein [Chytridium lagenaria]